MNLKKRMLAILLTLCMLLAMVSCNGTPGANGTDGKDGSDGLSAYQVAVENGYDGTEEEWLASLVGEKGEMGVQGSQGEKGEKGASGADGSTDSNTFTAGAVAASNSGIIDNCHVRDAVLTHHFYKSGLSGTHNCSAGGLVGSNSGTISNSTIRAEMSGTYTLHMDYYEYYSISGTDSFVTYMDVGGFTSKNKGNINNCYSVEDIALLDTVVEEGGVGGFTGRNEKTIVSSYASGNINAAIQDDIGGFVGINSSGATISKCFCTGNISVSDSTTVGYFVGLLESGSSLFKSYYNSGMIFKVGNTVTTPTNLSGIAETLTTLQSETMLVDTLAWSEDVWTFAAGRNPPLAWEKNA